MMSLPVRIGPPTVTINRDDRVVVSNPDGSLSHVAEEGFYARDTRFISGYELTLNGQRPVLLNSSSVRYFSARYEFTNPELIDPDGEIPRECLSLRLDRTVAGAVHEDFDLVNYGDRTFSLRLEVRIDSDFADVFEVRERRVVRRGQVNTSWERDQRELRTSYENRGWRRELVVRADKPDSPAQYANGRLLFDLKLPPKGVWHTCLHWLPLTGEDEPLLLPCNAITEQRAGIEPSHLSPVSVRTPNTTVSTAWRQAVRDMEALHLEDPQETERGIFIPAAGIPWYVTLFGRDALIVGMHGMTGYPELAAGALRRLADLQATEDDPQRDMEPGKILHEIRHGELAQLGLLPHAPYYGTHDATSLWLVCLSYLFHWTGNRKLATRYLDNVAAALRWIDESGDLDGDGFQEYRTRSEKGYYNQGWKDAGDAIPHADGSLASLPLALCELQGYVYDAKLRVAELYETLDMLDEAARLRAAALELLERFNERFWWESEGAYYLGLDGDKKPIESVASNMGHLLQSGIVPVDRAGRVVERLMADDMYSGWGIRTLSSDHRRYNPFSYHNGSVWPHDNAIICGGLRRYGYAAEAARVAQGMFEAAGCFQATRLPELFAGLPRDPGAFPVQYLGANVPQAWAAASIFRFVAVLCGLDARTDRDGERLYVDPLLPSWLPELTITDLRLGSGAVELRLKNGRSEILENSSGFECTEGPAPPRRGTPEGTGPVTEPVTRPS